MRPFSIFLVGLLLLATSAPAYGQSLIYCPTAPEERSKRCSRVGEQIAQDQRRIDAIENQLRNPGILLVRVEVGPEESQMDYRTRVALQKGVATSQSNTWLTVLGHFYNPIQQRMYVALARENYWHYVWEGVDFDPELAEAAFRQRERFSRTEKAFQLENPDSVVNQLRYSLETLLAFERECCSSPNADKVLPAGPEDHQTPAAKAFPPAAEPQPEWP
ncbi:MAG: hypothetical protein QNJ01_10875 [Desulfobacterales bacterium]|nr:hypothetical protein [Desulfobacterales bacterium]